MMAGYTASRLGLKGLRRNFALNLWYAARLLTSKPKSVQQRKKLGLYDMTGQSDCMRQCAECRRFAQQEFSKDQ